VSEVIIHFPATDEGGLTYVMRAITEAICKATGEEGGYGLGGRHGYGMEWDSDVFMMHPYCWCELETCPWCCGCNCPESSYHYFVDGKEVDFAEWMAFYEREVTADIHTARLAYDRQSEAANRRRTTR